MENTVKIIISVLAAIAGVVGGSAYVNNKRRKNSTTLIFSI